MRRRGVGRAAAVLITLILTSAAPGVASAWLPDGHMATGALAHDALKRRDAEAVAAVVRLMQFHPQRARFDERLGALTGEARDRRLFELMARWPDDARRGPFDRDAWHYDQKVVSGARWVLPPAFGQAEPAFRRNLRIARDPEARAADRAVALCWVFHIVGDMHQPLHTALWMSARFPITDQGGNASYVRTSAEARAQKLHWFWDSAGGAAGLGRESPTAFTEQLARDHPDRGEPPPRDPAAAFDGWVADSRQIARDVVYARGAQPLGTAPANAPVLSADYIGRARSITAERLALAGHRTGALLVGLRF